VDVESFRKESEKREGLQEKKNRSQRKKNLKENHNPWKKDKLQRGEKKRESLENSIQEKT